MKKYLSLIRRIIRKGAPQSDRTGTGTRAIFGAHLNFDLSKGFPLVTTKETNFQNIAGELLWFLSGSTNINDLNSGIWNAWADKSGSVGPLYGEQWRSWIGSDGKVHDQIKEVQFLLRNRPNTRRALISTWNVPYLPDEGLSPAHNVTNGHMALAPCHGPFQFKVSGRKLHCAVYQRSADVLLGLPYNIASYALLTELMAATLGLEAGTLTWFGGDVHLYNNHQEAIAELITRKPKELPYLEIITKRECVTDYTMDDFKLHGYECHPPIKAPVSV